MEKTADLFRFIVSTGKKEEQLQITVYKPERTSTRISQEPKHRPSDATCRALLQTLNPAHVEREPSATLVRDAKHKSICIDSVAAGVSYRDIRIVSNKSTFAMVKIDVAAELCYTVGYQVRLLKFLKSALVQSMHKAYTYRIRVKVEKRENKAAKWIEEILNHELTKPLVKTIGTLFRHKSELVVAKRLLQALNMSKIAKESEMITHVTVAIEKQVAKLAEKEGAEMVAKKVPIVSTFVGAFFGAYRAYEGDFTGAFLEVASGILADIPGPGTAASLAIDLGLMAKDIKEVMDSEEKQTKQLEKDVSSLKTENSKIQKELEEILPETPLSGNDKYYDNFFNETHLANVDDISKIHIQGDGVIEGIQVEYRHGEKGAQHGSGGGGGAKQGVKAITMALEADERITRVEVSTHAGAVSSLSFHTDSGRRQGFGKVRGQTQLHEFTDGTYLAAIKGYDGFKSQPGSRTSKPGGKVLPAIGFVSKVIH